MRRPRRRILNEETAMRSAGAPWQPPTYDPDLNLLVVPIGQPTPTYNGKSRPGANRAQKWRSPGTKTFTTGRSMSGRD